MKTFRDFYGNTYRVVIHRDKTAQLTMYSRYGQKLCQQECKSKLGALQVMSRWSDGSAQPIIQERK